MTWNAFELTDWIVSIAAGVAVLSALYAKWQASAADKSNEIALHGDRLKIYDVVLYFYAKLTADGVGIPSSTVWEFRHIADLSEFYFDPPIHAALDTAFTRGLKLLSLNDELAEEEDKAKKQTLNSSRYALMISIRDDCYQPRRK